MPNFIVNCVIRVKAENATLAIVAAEALLPRTGSVLSTLRESNEKPVLSDGLKAFLKAQADNNDQDVMGDTTDLNYCLETIRELSAENVWTDAEAQEHDDFTTSGEQRDFADKLTEELKALVNHWGGATTVKYITENR